MPDHEFQPGDVVTDIEDADDKILVLDALDKRADQAVVYREPNGNEHTVDDYNGHRWPDSPVVEVAYFGSLNWVMQDAWTVDDVIDAYESNRLTESEKNGGLGGTTYSFPEARLEPYDND